jgi:hypothetical protein
MFDDSFLDKKASPRHPSKGRSLPGAGSTVGRPSPTPQLDFIAGLLDADVGHKSDANGLIPLKTNKNKIEAYGGNRPFSQGFRHNGQAQFARLVGVTQSYLSALKHGEKEPGAAVLLAISREFRKSVDWLLTGHTEQ